jgi:Superinfection immunity protein
MKTILILFLAAAAATPALASFAGPTGQQILDSAKEPPPSTAIPFPTPLPSRIPRTAERAPNPPSGGFYVVVTVLFVGYFFPAIVAALRHHRNADAICVLNLFLGWTFLGWVAAIVWAMTNPTGEAR